MPGLVLLLTVATVLDLSFEAPGMKEIGRCNNGSFVGCYEVCY